MIRPYLAVVKDSFREAVSSRILPFLLILFTVVLVALAGIGLREQTAWELKTADLYDAQLMMSKLRQRSDSSEPSPGRRIWSRLPEKLRTETAPDDAEPFAAQVRSENLRQEINRQLRREDFYDAEEWRGIELNDEAKSLLETGPARLPPDRLARLNRLLLDAAFPAAVAPAAESSVEVTYLSWDVPLNDFFTGGSFRREDVEERTQSVLAGFCSYFVGKFGVFVAILVSANIIPRMFEPGAIDLLLSKPVSRSMLFLTKFFSGCAFILINTAYFMFGLWLIVGLRIGVWSSTLLLAIPVFMFVFAIVYSFSALAGVLWRNPIISVLVAVLFWGVFIGVGVSKGAIDHLFRNPNAIAAIVPAGDALLVANKSGEVFRWSEPGGWTEVFAGSAQPKILGGLAYPLIGPVYDPEADRLLAIYSPPSGMNLRGGSGTLLVGHRLDDWQQVRGIAAPPGTRNLFVGPEGGVYAGAVSGVYRLEGNPTAAARPFVIFGVDISKSESAGEFVRLGPADSRGWNQPFASALHPGTLRFAVYHGGRLSVVAPDSDGEYVVGRTTDLKTAEAALVAFAGDQIVVALANGEIRVVAERNLELTQRARPFGESEPRSVFASDDGRWFGVLFHDQRLWLYDAQERRAVDAGVSGQGSITAATFGPEGSLYVAARMNRITEYRPGSWDVVRRYSPSSTFGDLAYRYLLVPAYTILPKPGGLDYLVTYLFTGKKSEALPGTENDLRAERQVYDLWRPVWENLAFLTVILALTCLYVSRKDF